MNPWFWIYLVSVNLLTIKDNLDEMQSPFDFHQLHIVLTVSHILTTIFHTNLCKKKFRNKIKQKEEKWINLQIPFTFPKLIIRRRWKCCTIDVTSIFYSICFPTSNFMPKFLLKVFGRKAPRTTISTLKNLVCHFLKITEGIVSEKSYQNLKYMRDNTARKNYNVRNTPATLIEGHSIICVPLSKTKWLNSGCEFEPYFFLH